MAQKLEATFSSLVVSLGSATAMHLGLAENPTTGKTEKDLNMAELNIDFLLLLREKTKGNLSDAEKNLLNSVIQDLQMRFVQSK